MSSRLAWCFYCGLAVAALVDCRIISKREFEAVEVPENWRDSIDNDVLQYHQNKKPSATSDRFEGDIQGMDPEAMDATTLQQNAITTKDKLWTDGVVPFSIKPDDFSADEINVIGKALRDMMTKTCLTFIPRTNEQAYITFVKSTDGCYSYVGRINKQQFINLQPNCVTHLGEVQHEVMHAIGFQHEQSRNDRDNYVRIIWQDIPQSDYDMFQKFRGDTFNIPYDYNSIMHYAYNEFSIDPKNRPTILPNVGSNKVKLGNRVVMSPLDVRRINTLYTCSPDSIKGGAVSAPDTSTPAPDSGTTVGVTDSPVTTKQPVTGSPTEAPVPVVGKTVEKTQARCPATPNGLSIDNCQSADDCVNADRGTLCCTFCQGVHCSNYCS